MNTADDLRKQAAALLAEAVRLDAQVKDEFEDGTVISWEKQFKQALVTTGHRASQTVYTYVAIKVLGKWYATGKNLAGIAWDWDQLVKSIGDSPIWYATAWKEVDW